MELTNDIVNFIKSDVKNRFLRYVSIDTTSDETSSSFPSTPIQFDLAKILKSELEQLGLINIELDEYCYIYATLPASSGYESAPPFNLLAHMDTSPAALGKDVKPLIRTYEGKPLIYPDDPSLTLSEEDSPILSQYLGQEIITASGLTLLGADNKAGIAEIMTALAAFQKFPVLKHGPITVCFTPDEEVGRGVNRITIDRLAKFGYTIDGGEIGELESECFDAWKADFVFHGLSVHPGYAKNKMLNALAIATRFFASLPEHETPEHTEKREGFYHLYNLTGSEEKASASLILRDFEKSKNEKRIEFLQSLIKTYENLYTGLKIDITVTHSYENMAIYLDSFPEVVEKAEKAISLAGIDVKRTFIRGGTDGARLSAMGHPTPNIFAGGLLFHSRKEYIPTIALQKAVETIIFLSEEWT